MRYLGAVSCVPVCTLTGSVCQIRSQKKRKEVYLTKIFTQTLMPHVIITEKFFDLVQKCTLADFQS